jgi:lipid II:glycine glycyltransferase (peptidoglycan interpeptide bridge formation enzyme)
MYLGPLFPDIDGMKQEKKQIFLLDMQKAMDRFIKKDLKSNYILIKTSPGFEDCRSFRWGGYTIEPRFTYYIDLSEGTNGIWKNFNRSLRYYIEKAKKEGIVVVQGDKDDALYIYDLLKERKRVKSSKEFLGSVYDTLSPDHLKIFLAKAGSERLSGIITLIHKDQVSFWIGSPKYSYKGISPNELVLWESIRWAGEQGYNTYEIVGADDYVLFPFKRKFNGKIIQYYHMKWYSPLLNVIASVYSSVKKRDDNVLDV